MNTVNKLTFDHIKKSEGLRLEAYKDPGSVNGLPITIGYGTTKIDGKPIKLGTKITEKLAENYLYADIQLFAKKVAALVKVKLNDNQFGALVSFAYNIGLDAFEKSTLLRLLNGGDFKSVPAQMRRWNKNDGKVMQGLINRREAEIALWFTATEKAVEGDKPTEGHKGSRTLLSLLLALLKLFLNRGK